MTHTDEQYKLLYNTDQDDPGTDYVEWYWGLTNPATGFSQWYFAPEGTDVTLLDNYLSIEQGPQFAEVAPRKSKRTHGVQIHWLHLAALALGCAIPMALSAASGVGVVGALLAVIA